jgi:hypothetical protein
MFPAAKTLSNTKPITLSCKTHRPAATIREDAIPRLKMTDKIASIETNERARATLTQERSGACPGLDSAIIIESILLKLSEIISGLSLYASKPASLVPGIQDLVDRSLNMRKYEISYSFK